MNVHELKLESLKHVSMEEFSEYGRIIGRDEEQEEFLFHLRPVKPLGVQDVDVAVQAFWDVVPMKDLKYRFSLGMNWIKTKPEGTIIDWTECHLETYEFFFPLGGKELIFVLAPPGAEPSIEKTRAFLIGPDEGIMLDKRTWHYPPFAPYGITPVIMPRYGDLAEVTGSVTEAYGRKYNTPSPPYIKGGLHCLETEYYGKGFRGEYNFKVV